MSYEQRLPVATIDTLNNTMSGCSACNSQLSNDPGTLINSDELAAYQAKLDALTKGAGVSTVGINGGANGQNRSVMPDSEPVSPIWWIVGGCAVLLGAYFLINK